MISDIKFKVIEITIAVSSLVPAWSAKVFN